MSFFYTYIEGIRDDEDSDQEEMDNRAFGNIFHAAAELLYKDFEGKVVTHDFIQKLLNEKNHPTLHRIAEEAFRQKLFNINEKTRKTPKLNGLQYINFEIVVTFLINLLKYDLTLTRLEIVSLEKTFTGKIKVDGKDIPIGGNIDRLDIVTDTDGIRRMRVIDYKTGRLRDKLNLNSIEEIFMPEKIKSHTDYYLQALLYASILEHKEHEISTGLLYVQHAAEENYNPLLQIAKQPITNASEYREEFQQGLSKLISEILNTDIPFLRTQNTNLCKDCPFTKLCY